LHRYSYDKIYQLTGVDYPAGFFVADTTFNYDSAGNRSTVITGGTTNYATNNLNQYTSVGGVAYSYDDNGNLTGDGTHKYYYDCENRLTDVNDANDQPIASYSYDAFGRGIQKMVDGGQTTVKYLYDGDQIICEYDGSGKLVRKFLYGTGIDEPVRMTNVLPSADMIKDSIVNHRDFAVIAKNWLLDINDPIFDPNTDLTEDGQVDLADVKALADSWLTNGNRNQDYYYHYDGLGSVIALTNSVGNTVETYNYDVYGRADSGSAVGNPYLFTGRQYDVDTGLYYYRARYYSFTIGRFLQVDPVVGYTSSLNLYGYCGNTPINCLDPFGQNCSCNVSVDIYVSQDDSVSDYVSQNT